MVIFSMCMYIIYSVFYLKMC